MKNTIIWGFNSKGASEAIEILKEKQIITIKAWFGNTPQSTQRITDLFEGNLTKTNYYGENYEIYQQIFHDSIYQFMDMMSRHSFYSTKSFHDKLNLYNIMFDYFAWLLKANCIELILFSNLPHEGPDLILYKIAKLLHIKTILFYQSIFPDKFFYVYDLHDFGSFRDIPAKDIKEEISIPKKHEKNLFYMKYNFKRGIPFSLQTSSFLSLVRSIFDLNHYFRLKSYFKTKGSIENAQLEHDFSDHDTIPDKFFNFLAGQCQRYKNHKISKKYYFSVKTDKVDLSKNFIYFPLHLQPELTTSVLGGIYVDQLLAVEKLSKIIPPDWHIYIKENPKQTEKMRGRWFFTRLNSIKNAKVIPSEFDTYKLMDACIFIATITGTAGWEAISGGKNVLIFGNPWYKSLPGVFSFNEAFFLDRILSYTIDHQELEHEFSTLLGKMGDGVIDEYYATLVENYDMKMNAAKIASFIENQIL